MDELITLRRFCKEHDTYGLVTFLVGPDESTLEYTRLIEREFMETITKEQFRFYTDDMAVAILRELKDDLESLPDAESEASQDSSFHKETDLNTSSR